MILLHKTNILEVVCEFNDMSNNAVRQNTSLLSASLGKMFFAWRFISNENISFWLTISYQKPFVLYVSVFYSQIFTQKLKLRPKVGPRT